METLMLRRLTLVLFLFSITAFAQPSPQPESELTIEAIAAGNLTGHWPESVQWMPDGTKLTFIDQTTGEGHGELWAIDAATGEKKVLVSETKLSSLAPPATETANERQREWN